MDPTVNTEVAPLKHKNSDIQSKPLLDGVEEEKYGANTNILMQQQPILRANKSAQSYANYNNPNFSKKRNLHKIYEGMSILCIFGLMAVSIYFNNINKDDPGIQAIISTIWCCRILVRLIALYLNDRWYFGSKSKFTKLRAELFKFTNFGRISSIWILLSIIGCIFLISVPFIETWCGAYDSQYGINHSIGIITEFIVNILTIWVFNIVVYWYCDHHIQRINSFVAEIGNKKKYRTRSSVSNKDSPSNKNAIEIAVKNIIQVSSSNTCIEQEINYTKQLWEKWVSYAFIIDIIYLLFIVSLWLFTTKEIVIFCKESMAIQICIIFGREFVRFIGLFYGVVRMNNMTKSKILEKTVKELGCKFNNNNNNNITNIIQQQIVFQSFYIKLKEFPVGFEILETKVYWTHFYVLLCGVVVLWLAVMLRLNV